MHDVREHMVEKKPNMAFPAQIYLATALGGHRGI